MIVAAGRYYDESVATYVFGLARLNVDGTFDA